VTIAADPLFTDTLASKVFDRKGLLGRGILPVALIIRNDNDFAIEIDAESVEIAFDNRHVTTLEPLQVIHKLYSRPLLLSTPRATQTPFPLPRVPKEAVADFQQKYLGNMRIFSHSNEGGFLFFPVGNPANLAGTRIYLPHVRRIGSQSQILFFEFNLPDPPKPPSAKRK